MDLLHFDPREALRIGACRFVFPHPRHADRVVKVITPRFAARFTRRRRRYGLTRYFGGNKIAVKEIAYLLHLEARRPDLLPLFAWIHGPVPTNLGLGLISEKISGDDGKLAPTLRELAEAGQLNERHRALARDLCDKLDCDHVVFEDMEAKNIVAEGPLDRPQRLVIIDGFGDPRRLLWPWWNHLAQRKQLNAFRDELGIASSRPHSTRVIRPSVYGS